MRKEKKTFKSRLIIMFNIDFGFLKLSHSYSFAFKNKMNRKSKNEKKRKKKIFSAQIETTTVVFSLQIKCKQVLSLL